jgi:hypothetical protein
VPNPQQEEEWIKQLEAMDITTVRDNLNHNKISPQYVNVTSKWLSAKEREAEARRESSNSSQIDLMRRASEAAERASSAAERQALAAERANKRATIALAIAIISIIITIVGIAVTHWDTHK